MPTIERLGSVEIGGAITAAGVQPGARTFAGADEKSGARVVLVPHVAVPLLKRADIVPPPSGPLTREAVDAKLHKSDLTIEQRLQVKSALRNCGLL